MWTFFANTAGNWNASAGSTFVTLRRICWDCISVRCGLALRGTNCRCQKRRGRLPFDFRLAVMHANKEEAIVTHPYDVDLRAPIYAVTLLFVAVVVFAL